MANKSEQDLTSLVPNAPQVKRANLLDKDVKAISTTDSHAFGRQVRNEQLALDVAAKQSEQKFTNSTRDMQRDVQYVQAMENASSKVDFTVNSVYESASGKTTVTVRKNNNTAAMVIAVVVGIVILFLLNR